MQQTQARVRVLTLLALAALYVAAGKLGLSLALLHESASAVWPPTGIALAAFLLFGRSAWPAVFAGAFLVNVTTAGSPATSLVIAGGNTLEGWVGAELVRRYAGGLAAFDRPGDVFRFFALAGLAATAVSPSIGVTTLCLGGYASWTDFERLWLTWWLGDAGGAVVVAPALVLWAQRPWPVWKQTQIWEAAGLLAALAATGLVAFGPWLTPLGGSGALSFLCIPPAIWTAFRFGRRETATAVLILSCFAVWGAVLDTGPALEENRSLVLLQLFMGVVSVTSLSLAAVVSQRRRVLNELERQTSELARSNAELDEFARVVSHDLKAPLRGISSLTAWIIEDCKDVLRFESQEHLRLLGERARRMSRLIDGVLSYSRVGREQSPLERVDSEAVVEEIIDSLKPLRGISVRIEGSLPVVLFDRTQLTQVLQNLIQNAVQHIGRQSGEVVVSGREDARSFEFTVRDDGVGIPETHLHRIFQMFYVLDPEGDTTGVGLAIVKKIVEMRGGSISVDSAPGRGASFRFTIPKPAR